MDPVIATLRSGSASVIDISQDAAQSGISSPRVLRRSARTTSSHTASDIQEESRNELLVQSPTKRRQHKRRHSVALPKKGLPLSEDTIQSCSKRARRRKSGPCSTPARTQIAVASEAKAQGRQGASSGPTDNNTGGTRARHIDGPAASPAADDKLMPANVLLSLARQSVELQTDWFGRRPLVMDVVLDLKHLARRQSDALRRTCAVVQQQQPGRVDNHDELLTTVHANACAVDPVSALRTFHDRTSLSIYWTEQAAIWAGMERRQQHPQQRTQSGYQPRPSSATGSLGFPESGERSTALWSSVLNPEPGHFGDDVTSVCSGRVSADWGSARR